MMKLEEVYNMGCEGLIMMTMLLVVVLGVFMAMKHITNSANETVTKLQSSMDEAKNTTDKSTAKEDTTAKDNSTDKNTQNTAPKQETKETPKQETKETQPTTVINNITNNNQNQYKTVVINEAQNPTKQENSFLSYLGSNLIAELVVAVLFAGLTWFIRDYIKVKKQNKLNRNKEKIDMNKD